MRILHLPIKRKWFNMIRCGEKREEYREGRYWDRRFAGQTSGKWLSWSAVCLRNGYHKDSPRHTRRLLSIRKGKGLPWWGAPRDREVWILELGDAL